MESKRHQRVQSTWEDSEDGGVPLPVFHHSTLPPELDSHEIPYVHLNSLTGYANECDFEEDSASHPVYDSAICWQDAATQTSAPTTPIYELSALPLTPREPMQDLMGSEIFPLVYQAAETIPLADSIELADSTAHYTSEQQLFEATQVPLPPSRPDSPCDLATFLAMGHNENCWCRDCEEAPEMVRDEDISADEDDGWMVWSTTDDEADFEVISAVTTPLPVTIAIVEDEDEREINRRKCAVISDWDDFLQGKSQLEAELEDVEPAFLGYVDDGLAFARASEDDWVWNV